MIGRFDFKTDGHSLQHAVSGKSTKSGNQIMAFGIFFSIFFGISCYAAIKYF